MGNYRDGHRLHLLDASTVEIEVNPEVGVFFEATEVVSTILHVKQTAFIATLFREWVNFSSGFRFESLKHHIYLNVNYKYTIFVAENTLHLYYKVKTTGVLISP
jgi:hypothetical protein